MTKHLRPSGRVISVDHAITHDMTRQRFTNHQFQRLVAKSREFIDCDFSYSEFDSSYLRKCIFNSCNFTGCKFTRTILRGSKFIGCKFDYTQFVDTHVEPEILDSGCPGKENMQRPGGRGQLPTRGSHGSGRAPFGHPAPQIMVSLLNGTHCARRAQGGGDRC